MPSRDQKSKPSTADYRRWNRFAKSWPRVEPFFNAARNAVDDLGIIQRDSAFAHFIGGCTTELKMNGTVSRRAFIRLLYSASAFAKKINSQPSTINQP